MEYFYSGGGNNRPDFTYRFLVSKITEEMYDWCGNYPLTGPFERWHIIHNTGNFERDTIIQFESRKAAYMFRIAFSEYITENKTYSFAKQHLEEGFK
jgi:hypothetical protein